MSCSRTLEFCVNHSFLLDPAKPKIFDNNFVDKLKSIKPQLELFLGYYAKYNENSCSEFRQKDHKQYIKDFVIKLAQFLNLSCEVSFNILSNYLAVDGILNGNNLESMLTRGYDIVSLMKSIGKYYRQERLSLIRLFRYVFGDRKHEWVIISNIIVTASGNSDIYHIFQKILLSYETIIDEMSQNKSTLDHWDNLSDEDSVIYCLEEQVLLLETLLMATHFLKDRLSNDVLINALSIFQTSSSNIEIRISRTMNSKPSIRNIIERIGLLQGLIIVETVRLDKLFCDDGHFITEGESLSKLCVATLRFGSKRCDGLMMLLTSLLCTSYPSKISSQVSSSKLAEVAIVKLGLFKYLSMILTSEPYSITKSHCSYLELVVHRVIFDLLSYMCHKVHINSFEPSVRHDIATVMSKLLRPINLYSDVKLFKSGFLKMLEDLSISFPVNLDILTVVSSLMDKSMVEKEGENDVVCILTNFLDNLMWFCDRRSVESNYVKVDNDMYEEDDGKCAKSCQLTSQYRPYQTRRTGFILERGQEGFFLDDNIVWAVRYGAWDVISAEIEMTCMMLTDEWTDGGPSLVGGISEQFTRLEVILDFLVTCIQNSIRTESIIVMFCELWELVDNDRFLKDGCEGCLVRLIDLAGHILNLSSDPGVIARIVRTKNLFPHRHASSLKLIPNESIVAKAWSNVSLDCNLAIVQAYLRFSLKLINAEKFFDGDVGIIPTSLIFGSIVFVISTLFVELMQATVSSPCHLVELAYNGLLVLNEIFSLEPCLYSNLSHNRLSRLDLITQVAVDIIGQSSASVRTILSLSSIDVDTLVAHTNVSSQMLVIEGIEQRMSEVVLMALTVVKSLFLLKNGLSVMLDILNSTVTECDRAIIVHRPKKEHTVTYTHRYVLSLLELLGYPYGVKIVRVALVVLREIVVHTNVSIIACLGEKTSQVRDILLRFVGSSDQDQVCRGLVFEFMAECVMGGRHGILPLVFTSEDGLGDDRGSKSVGYQSCLDVVRDFQLDDGVSMVLLVSVSKFLLSLWIHECQNIVIAGHSSTELWSSLLPPMEVCLAKMCTDDPSGNLPLYEYVGNVMGLYAMEVYSSAPVSVHPDVVKSLNEALGHGLMLRFLDSLQVTSSSQWSQLTRKSYLDRVVMAATWWKALLFSVSSIDPSTGIKWHSLADDCSLVDRVLDIVPHLMAHHWPHHESLVVDLTDNLVSSLLNIVHKRLKSLSHEKATDLIERIVSLLTTMITAPCFQTQRSHADLLACCSSLLLDRSIDPHTLHKTSLFAEQFILMLTLRPSTSVIDAKTLVHAITAYMASNNDCRHCRQWVSDLINSGTLVNCLSLLHDKIQAGDLSLLPQTIVSLLTQVAASKPGATRLLQSSLCRVLDLDLGGCANDQDVTSVLGLMTQLVVAIVQESSTGPSAHIMALRFVATHWDRFQGLANGACRRVTAPMTATDEYDVCSKMLSVTAGLCDLLWHLAEVRGLWSSYWPPAIISGMMGLVTTSVAVLESVLSDPWPVFVPGSAHILRGASRSAVLNNTFSGHQSMFGAVTDQSQTGHNTAISLASSRLEATVYRLLQSCLLVFARLTCIASEDSLYAGGEYTGTLLLCDFGERRSDVKCQSLSFGVLFSLLNCSQHLLKDSVAPLLIGTEKVSIDSEQLRQIHEVCLGIVVSHALTYLARLGHSHKSQRSNLVLNLKSELNCYLDSLSKSRRRSTLSSSSPISHGPRLTSTPYLARASSIGDNLDHLCAAMDSFKKSLDYF